MLKNQKYGLTHLKSAFNLDGIYQEIFNKKKLVLIFLEVMNFRLKF